MDIWEENEDSKFVSEEDMRRIKRFCLFDDDFMTKCFEGSIECVELVLWIIMDMEDLSVTEARTQVFAENLLNRSVRLDVLASDSTGRKYNIEIQRQNKGADKRRARYHSSMIDVNILKKGDDFDNLPETYVIFITENDVIGQKKSVYHINRYIEETGEKFGDGANILYVNGAYRDETPIGMLMHDFACTKPSDMKYEVLKERARFFKESKEGNVIMSGIMEELREEALRKGVEQGRIEGLRSMALRILESGRYSIEEIAEISGLSVDEIKELGAYKTA